MKFLTHGIIIFSQIILLCITHKFGFTFPFEIYLDGSRLVLLHLFSRANSRGVPPHILISHFILYRFLSWGVSFRFLRGRWSIFSNFNATLESPFTFVFRYLSFKAKINDVKPKVPSAVFGTLETSLHAILNLT